MLEGFARLAAAICSAAFALALWDLGSRPPKRLFSDIASAFADVESLVRGTLRLLVGAIFGVLSLAAVASALPSNAEGVFSTLSTVVAVTGLAVDALAGDIIRTAVGIER